MDQKACTAATNRLQKPQKTVVTGIRTLACFMPALLLTANALRGYPFSPICACMTLLLCGLFGAFAVSQARQSTVPHGKDAAGNSAAFKVASKAAPTVAPMAAPTAASKATPKSAPKLDDPDEKIVDATAEGKNEGNTGRSATKTAGWGVWARGLAALALSVPVLTRFFEKYAAPFLGLREGGGRLAALYLNLPLPPSVKAGTVYAVVAALGLLCVLGISLFLRAAYGGLDKKRAIDWRQTRKQLLCVAPAALCLFFTVLFFGPLDLVIENGTYLSIWPEDLYGALGIGCLLATLLLSVAAACMNRRAFLLTLCVLFGLALASYLQGTYFNTDLGTLDGTPVEWRAQSVAALTGAALWLACVGVQILLCRVLAGKYERIVPFVSLAIVVMQLVALLSIAQIGQGRGARYALDGQEAFTVSSKENVIVFTLDYLDNGIVNEILARYPETRKEFQDFLYFDNTSEMYQLTFPSLVCMMTGTEYDVSVPTRQFVENAWHGERANAFYGMLQARNFQRDLFMDASYVAMDAKNLRGVADNLVFAPLKLTKPLLVEVLKLSAYRYAPLCLKADYWTTTEAVNTLTQEAKQGIMPLNLDDTFYTRLEREGLSLDTKHNRFAWHHLRGAHYPFDIDETGRYTKKPTDAVRQSRGFLVAVAEYLRQMRKCGVYDDATIVISADHGGTMSQQIALLIKRPHQKGETLAVTHAPAAQQDTLATLADCMGEPYDAFGTSIFDLEENAVRERVTRFLSFQKQCPQVPWVGDMDQWNMYNENGMRFNALLEYRYTGNGQVLSEKLGKGDAEADAVLPLYDSFY